MKGWRASVNVGAWRTCDCGKRGFATRKGARSAMKSAHPGDSALSVYRCLKVDGNWHYGHLNMWFRNQRAAA